MAENEWPQYQLRFFRLVGADYPYGVYDPFRRKVVSWHADRIEAEAEAIRLNNLKPARVVPRSDEVPF